MTNAVLEVSMTSFANLVKGQLVRPQADVLGGKHTRGDDICSGH